MTHSQLVARKLLYGEAQSPAALKTLQSDATFDSSPYVESRAIGAGSDANHQ